MPNKTNSASSHPRRRFVFATVLGLALAAAPARSQETEVPPPIAERLSVKELQAKTNVLERVAKGAMKPPAAGNLIWNFLGPQPVTNEYWSGNANASGRVSSLAAHPTDPNIVYAATSGGGVWKSTDAGMTWMPLTDQISSLASGALAIDPQNVNFILYGTGEQNYSGDSFYGDGLFSSADAGATWSKVASKTQVGNYIAKVGISGSQAAVFHVCSDAGYVRSTDGGLTWTGFKPASQWCNDLVRSATAPNTVFAGFYGNGIYKSVDDGVNWTQLTGGLPLGGFQRITLAISTSNPNVVYASFINPSGALFGMYKTIDGGTTWSLLAGTPNYVCNQGWYDTALAVSPTDPNTVYAAGVFPYCAGGQGGIIKSANGGASWTNITQAPDGTQVHPDQHALEFSADGTLFVGCDGGVWKTTSGGASWSNLNSSLGTALLYTVGIHSTDPTVLISGTQDNGSVQYQGVMSWPQIAAGDGGPVVFEWGNPDVYYTTYVNMNPLYKWMRPISYQGTVTGPWGGERADWANGPLVADPNLPDTLLAGTFRVWQSVNSGASWNPISLDLTGGLGVLRALAVSPVDSNTIYSGSSSGRVYATFDRGANWTLSTTGLPSAGVTDIVANPVDSLTAYLCVDQVSSGRLFQSSDGGVSWQDLTGSLPPGLRGMSLAVDFVNGVFYLGTDFGVYSTADRGVTWIQEGMPSLPVYSVRIDTANGLIVAATHGRGMWSAMLTAPPQPARLTISPTTGI
jgi:photosystem II stability/assembly factor-like uncharacterized protein